MNSKNLLLNLKPFGVISRNNQRLISEIYKDDINDLETINEYLCLGNEVTYETILQICFMNIETNIESTKCNRIEDLKAGMYLKNIGKFKDEKPYYIFKSLSPSQVSVDEIDGKKKNYVSGILRSKADEDLKPVELYESRFKKRFNSKAVNSYKDNFAHLLKKKVNTYWNTKNTLILAAEKDIDKLVEKEFCFDVRQNEYFDDDRVNFKLGEICNCWKLMNSDEIKKLPFSNGYEKPSIIFSSNLLEATDYIHKYVDESKDFFVYLIGDKWFKGDTSLGLSDLVEVCKGKCKLNIITNLYAILNNNTIKLDGIEKNNISILNDEGSVKNAFNYYLNFVNCNDDFIDNLNILHKFIELSKEDWMLKSFNYALKKFIGLIYAQSDKNIPYIKRKAEELIDMGINVDSSDLEKINSALSNLISNRYGSQVKKEVTKIINDEKSTAVVVNAEVLEDTKKMYSEKMYSDVDFLSMNSDITDISLEEYDQIIIISPYMKERRRWMYSNLDTDLFFVVPIINRKFWKKSLSNEKTKLHEMIHLASDYEYFENSIKKIDQLIECISKYDSRHNVKDKIDDLIEDTSYDTELSLDDEINVNNNVEFNKNQEDSKNNNIVSTKYEISLKSGRQILGTEYGYTYILDKKNICRKILISKVKKDDEILDFDIPYSDVVYRFELKTKFKKNSEYMKENTQDYLDFYWKNELHKYVEKMGYSPLKLKRKFDDLDYYRTIGFYSAWISTDKIPIVPKNSEFIQKIGLLIKNDNLANNPEKYYMASKNIKIKLKNKRDTTLETFDGKNLDLLIKNGIASPYRDIVNKIDIVNHIGINRADTNRII